MVLIVYKGAMTTTTTTMAAISLFGHLRPFPANCANSFGWRCHRIHATIPTTPTPIMASCPTTTTTAAGYICSPHLPRIIVGSLFVYFCYCCCCRCCCCCFTSMMTKSKKEIRTDFQTILWSWGTTNKHIHSVYDVPHHAALYLTET